MNDTTLRNPPTGGKEKAMSQPLETIENLILEAQRMLAANMLDKHTLAQLIRVAHTTGRISVYDEKIAELNERPVTTL